jgi:Uma2 family endonuclease
LPYTVFPDGATVVIDNNRAREPDAAVQADAAGNLDSVVLDAPVIVVEVTSPSSSWTIPATKCPSISLSPALSIA